MCVCVCVCVCVCLVIHIGGKLIKHSEQAQTYANEETFYRLYALSVIPNCHSNIVYVLLAVYSKQAVIHVINSYTLDDNFTKEFSFHPEQWS